jgi:hypothetical protein
MLMRKMRITGKQAHWVKYIILQDEEEEEEEEEEKDHLSSILLNLNLIFLDLLN